MRHGAGRDDCETLGFVGELSELKGADELPVLLRRLTPEFAFRIAGRGPLGEWLETCVAELEPRRRSRVTLLDRVEPERMPEFYASIDCLLILSRGACQA